MRLVPFLAAMLIALAGVSPGLSAAADKGAPAASSPAESQPAAPDKPKNDDAAHNAPQQQAEVLTGVPEIAVAATGILFLVGLIATVGVLRKAKDWNLADMLSEKAEVPAAPQLPAPVVVQLPPPGGQQVAVPAAPVAMPAPPPVASSSRLIAFVGTIAMLAVFVGEGLYTLWAQFNGKPNIAANIDAAGKYLLYGSALYAPYAFNQLKSMFK